jgi:membrane protease YdiL (CAAX protease family)
MTVIKNYPAVFILLKKHGKINGVKDYWKRVLRTDNLSQTIILTVAFCLSQFIPNIIGNTYLGNPWYLFILYIPLMILGGGLEEIGWNGFFQPVLEERIKFVPAAAISGAAWAVWHIPLWFVQNSNQSSMNFVSFLWHCVVLSFVIAVLYKMTYSVFACVILHAWTNVLGGMFTRDALENPVGIKLAIVYILEIIVSIILFYIADRREKLRKIKKL